MDSATLLDRAVSIYALCDPESDAPRYVGKSVNPEQRLRMHLAPWNLQAGTRKNSWLKSLASTPGIKVLDVVPADEADDYERAWIAFFRAEGCRLVNGTDGGDGNNGMCAEARSRMGQRKFGPEVAKEIRERFAAGETTVALGAEFGVSRHTIGNVVRGKTWPQAGGPIVPSLGRKASPAFFEGGRQAAAERKGVPRTDEVRCRISEATKGQQKPSVQGEKHGRAKLTLKQVMEIRRRLELGETHRALGAEFGVSKTTIRNIGEALTWANTPEEDG